MAVEKRKVSQKTEEKTRFRYDSIDIRFGEIAIKGRNRGKFVSRLAKNVSAALEEESCSGIEQKRDRIIVRLDEESDIEGISSRLKKVFGIVWFAPVMTIENEIGKIVSSAILAAEKANGPVRIVAHRAYKGVAFDSEMIVSEILKKGAATGIDFEKDSDKKISINVTEEGTEIYDSKVIGAGGLPVGSSGRGIVLLSGGIDSPLAAYYAMKRGLEPIYLHAHAYGSNDDAASSKIRRIVSILDGYNGGSRVYFAPGHIFQSYAAGAGRYEMVLFKRFLYELASEIAAREGAGAIVTGESLGQVASQTLENLGATSKGIGTFVFRPLIGMDKQEIIDRAKAIGTYGISIEKYRDICSINARRPPTAVRYEKLVEEYERAKIGNAVSATLERCGIYTEKEGILTDVRKMARAP